MVAGEELAASSEEPRSWLSWWEPLAPSLEALARALAALLILLAPLTSLPANDLGWQLKAGEILSRTGHVPRVDTLSWTARGEPWLVHEWLTCWVFYQLFHRFGPLALVALKVALLWVTFCLVYRLSLRAARDRLVAAAATLLAAYTGRVFWDVRPQLVTYLMLALWLLILDRWRSGEQTRRTSGALDRARGERGDSATGMARRLRGTRTALDLRSPWVLPPLTLLWANCHAGFLLGLAVMAATLAGWWLDGLLRPGLRLEAGTLRKGWVVLGACALVSLLNPYGFHLWLYPFRLASHPEVMRTITEWFAPDLRDPMYRAYEVLVLLMVPALALGWGRGWRGEGGGRSSIADLLLLGATLHLSLTTVRHVPLFGLVAAPLWARYVSHAGAEVAGGLRRLSLPDRLGARALASAALLAALTPATGLMAGSVPWHQLSGYTFSSRSFPDAAVQRLRSAGLPGPLWNEYKWGGHLIWTLPEYPVFIDGRAEVYYRTAFDDFVTVQRLLPAWSRVLDRRGINLVLVEPSHRLARALDLSPGWTLFYSDPVSRVYVRRSALAGHGLVPDHPLRRSRQSHFSR